MACEYLKNKGFYASVDFTNNTLNYKVRQAQLAQYNIILVVGDKEKDGAFFDVRLNDGSRVGQHTMSEMLVYFSTLIPKPSDK